MHFKELIAAARNDPAGDYLQEAEALICCLIGITHLLVGVSEYPWKKSANYIDIVMHAMY